MSLAAYFTVLIAAVLVTAIVVSLLNWQTADQPTTKRVGYYICDSCSDRWCYDREQSDTISELINKGWLVLPGDVHYCADCRKDVERRVIDQRPGRSSRQESTLSNNPYLPPMGL